MNKNKFFLLLSALIGAMMTMGAAANAASSFREYFQFPPIAANLEASGGVGKTCCGGQKGGPVVEFDQVRFGGRDTRGDASGGLRSFLRTKESDYHSVNFTAEVTVTIPSAPGTPNIGRNIVFFGLGNANVGPFGGPDLGGISVQVNPTNFFPRTTVIDGAGPIENPNRVLIDEKCGGNGRYRLRMVWDARSKNMEVFVDKDYTDGPFVADCILPRISGADNSFDDSNSHIYIGGDWDAVFEDLSVVTTPLETDAEKTLAHDLVAYYSFDVNADDDSDNENNGTVNNEVYYTDGYIGRAVAIYGNKAVVSFSNEKMSRNTDSFALSAWINPKSYPAYINRNFWVTKDGKLVYTLAREYSFIRSTRTHSETDTPIESTSLIPLNKWTHVTVDFNHQQPWVGLFINGKLDSEKYLDKNTIKYRPILKSVLHEISSRYHESTKILIDEVMLHKKALTWGEVTYLSSRKPISKSRFPTSLTKHSSRHMQTQALSSNSDENCGGFGQRRCYLCTEWFPWYSLQGGTCRTQTAKCNVGLDYDEIHDQCQCSTSLKPGRQLTNTGSDQCDPNRNAGIEVIELPSTIYLVGKTYPLNDIVGYQATIRNAPLAKFHVPSGNNYAADCGRLEKLTKYECDKSGDACRSYRSEAKSCDATKPACSTLGIRDNKNVPLNFPLYTLQEWNNFRPGGLKINGNWFDIDGPPNFPHRVPCTDIYGLSMSEGVTVSSASKPDPSGGANNLLDALVIIEDQRLDGKIDRQIKILRNSEIAGQSGISQAVGGFLLMKDGRYNRKVASSAKPTTTGARTAVGLSADGQNMYVVVVQPGSRLKGMTARDIASYVKSLGASDVINLDNSGSSQFYYDDIFPPYKSLMGDKDMQERPAYRPIPNYLEVRIE